MTSGASLRGVALWVVLFFHALTGLAATQRAKLQFRLETFNTFNRPQWKGVNAGCASTIMFGQPCTQTGNAEVNGDWGPRLIQLGLQFDF